MSSKNNIKNKSDVVETLSKDFPDITTNVIKECVNTIFLNIVESIALDKKVEIRGFGSFSKKSIRPRKHINPKTKKITYLGETTTIYFKPSKSLIQD